MPADVDSGDDGILYLKDIITGDMVPIQEMEAPTDLWGESAVDDVCTTPADDLNDLPISDLRHGDVVFVSEFSLVAVGQLFIRLLTGDLFCSGGSDAVHCFLVIDSDRTHAGVAHVTNTGACINLISQVADQSQLKTGRVYRLLADSDGAVRNAAAREAVRLVEAQIPFGTTKSLMSAFRDAKAGAFIHKRYQSRRISLQMFCTEFVMTSIQNAVVSQGCLDHRALIRATDIDGSACTPMQLETFLRDNDMRFGDWHEIGVCTFQYS